MLIYFSRTGNIPLALFFPSRSGGMSVNETMFRHRFHNVEKPPTPKHVGYDVPPGSYAAQLAMRAYRQMTADSFNPQTGLGRTPSVLYPRAASAKTANHSSSWDQLKLGAEPRPSPSPAMEPALTPATLHDFDAEAVDTAAASLVSYSKGSPIKLPVLDPRMHLYL